jgi:glycosyltransferase involved in cell wall biosynthesis
VTPPVVTAVIPTYRRPKLLERAVRSVLNQTYPHLVVAIYDNASGDDTRQVVERLQQDDPRIRYWCHAENIGAWPNWDFGVARVDTPFYSILCDDDLMLPAFYAEAVETLQRTPHAAFFCARCLMVDSLAGAVYHRNEGWPAGNHPPGVDSAAHMLRDQFGVTSVVFRSAVREKLGTFSFFPHDREYMAYAALVMPFAVSANTHAVFNWHSGSYSAGGSLNRIMDAPPDVMEGSYIMRAFRAGSERIAGHPDLSQEQRRQLERELAAAARVHALYLLMTQHLPAGKVWELDALAKEASVLNIRGFRRVMLRVGQTAARFRMGRILLVYLSRLVVAAQRRFRSLRNAPTADDLALIRMANGW